MENFLMLSVSKLALLSPECKAELAREFGFELATGDGAASTEPSPDQDDPVEEYAELGIQAARNFLAGCNPKTKEALRFMVNAGRSFSLAALATHMGSTTADLRNLWTGITKRTRTITHDDEQMLIKWTERDGDWTGEMNPISAESLQKVFNEDDIK